MGLYVGHRVRIEGVVHEVALVLGFDEGVLCDCHHRYFFPDPESYRDYITSEVLTCLWCVAGTLR